MKIKLIGFRTFGFEGGSVRRVGLWVAVLAFAALAPLVVAAQPIPPPWRDRLPSARPHTQITIEGASVDATLARTSNEQQLGLGYRDRLADGTGLLFIYADPSQRSFWMNGMRFCLDIIWIEGDQIVGAAESVCPVEGASDVDLPRYRSPEPVRYVLEMPAGWMTENGFSAGTPVRIHLPA